MRYYRSGSAASALAPGDLPRCASRSSDARAVLVTGVTALIGAEPHAGPVLPALDRPYGILVTGVGGTGW